MRFGYKVVGVNATSSRILALNNAPACNRLTVDRTDTVGRCFAPDTFAMQTVNAEFHISDPIDCQSVPQIQSATPVNCEELGQMGWRERLQRR